MKLIVSPKADKFTHGFANNIITEGIARVGEFRCHVRSMFGHICNWLQRFYFLSVMKLNLMELKLVSFYLFMYLQIIINYDNIIACLNYQD